MSALALGGHGFACVDAGAKRDLFGEERPSWFRCLRCYWQGPGWAITERHYPMPCTGRQRALEAA